MTCRAKIGSCVPSPSLEGPRLHVLMQFSDRDFRDTPLQISFIHM